MSHSQPKPFKVKQFREKGVYSISKCELFKIPVIRETLKQAAEMGLFHNTEMIRKLRKKYEGRL